jgi:hypothetical protein
MGCTGIITYAAAQLGEVFRSLGEVCNFAASILKFVTFITVLSKR